MNGWLKKTGIVAALGVSLGAFGAHGLEARLSPEMMEIYQTGVLYHLIHLAALLTVALGIENPSWHQKRLNQAGWCFLAGILFFSGSLYVLAISSVKILGAITPIGGVLFIVGWILLAFSGGRSSAS